MLKIQEWLRDNNYFLLLDEAMKFKEGENELNR